PRDFEGIAHARGERAAITVATLVGDRRKEAVQEIAVRRVQLDGVDAGADRTFGGIDEAVAHALHVRRRHLSRHRPIGAECNGGWGDRLPGVLSWCKRLAALPWPSRGGLASGMGELDAELGGTIPAAVGDEARKHGFAIIRIEPEAAVGDAAVALDAGGLNHDQRRPGIGEHTQTSAVPTPVPP